MTTSDYYNYMESLAEAHSLVQHSATDKHYFRGELEEFYTDLRNRVHFPAVIAESWENTFPEGEKDRETSYIIASAYRESKNWENIYSAIDLCERIGDEFLRRISYDAENGIFCGDVEFLSAVPLLDEQHLYAGVRYTIRLTSPFQAEPDPDIWGDL